MDTTSAVPAQGAGFNLELEAAPLRAAVALCYATGDRRSTMPVLANVCVRHCGTVTTLEATDLTVHVQARVAGAGAGEGAYTVPAKSLRDALPKGKGKVPIAYNGNAHLTVAGTTLLGLPASDYPAPPEQSRCLDSVERVALLDLLSRTVAAVSTDVTRLHLGGVMLGNRAGHAVAVATDGHRLHLAERHCVLWPWLHDVLVPLRGVQVLLRALRADQAARVEIGITKPAPWNLTVILTGCTINVRLLDERFPPYEMVVPTYFAGQAHVNRAELLAALEQCGKMANNHRVKIEAQSGKLRVSADNPDRGSATAELECRVERQALQIGVNARYLRDWLATCDQSRVTLEHEGYLSPLVVRPEGIEYEYAVVMPMRQ